MVIKAFTILISPGRGDSKSSEAPIAQQSRAMGSESPESSLPDPASFLGLHKHFRETQGPEKESHLSYLCDCGHVYAPLWAVRWEYWWHGPLRLFIHLTHCAWQRASAPSGFALLLHTTVCQVPFQVLGGEKQ